MIRQPIDAAAVERCLTFAKEIIGQGDQYNRFRQTADVQIDRTFVGKLGEYAFLLYLHASGIPYEEGDMFEIFPGQENADTFDFETTDGESVDIKTASKPFHQRIMVPDSQFHLEKDYYVGIKLNFQMKTQRDIIRNSVDTAEIYGYCVRNYLANRASRNFGEGSCKYALLIELQPIDRLIRLFG